MTKLYKQFKIEKPETVGETDKEFDKSNYIDWLEDKLLNQGQNLPLDSVSGSSLNLEGITKVQYTLDLINKNLNQKEKLEVVEWLERRVRP